MNDKKKDEMIFTVLVAEPWDFVSSDGMFPALFYDFCGENLESP